LRHHSPAISANACRARAASLPWLGMIAVALALCLSPGFALAEPAAKPPGQSVVTDGTRLAFLAGYRYWP